MEALNCRYINIKEFHAPIKGTEAEWKQARLDFENAGIKILGVGNITMVKEDEGEIRLEAEDELDETGTGTSGAEDPVFSDDDLYA